jgi:hypothetical protein
MVKVLEITNRKGPLALLILSALVALFFYSTTAQAGFTSDFLGWVLVYRQGDYSDVLHCFGYPGNHQLLHLVFFSMFRWFDINPLPWFSVFTGLHLINGFLLFYLIKRIGEHKDIRRAAWIASLGAILFLLSPYQGEVLTWRVCVHYLLTTAFILLILHQILSYLSRGRRTHLWGMHLLFIMALFSLELSFVVPILSLPFLLFMGTKEMNWKKLLFSITGVQLFLLASYLVLNRFTLGAVVGHYGAETHLSFELSKVLGNLVKYLTKYLGYTHFWSYGDRVWMYEHLIRPNILWAVVAAGTFLILSCVFFFRRLNGKVQLAFMSLLFFFIALAPVSNLFFSYHFPYENDRYGYLASAFFYPFMASLLFLLPAILRWLLIPGLFYFHFGFFVEMVRDYSNSGRVLWSLLEDYRWEDAEEVYVLGSVDNYNGIWVFKDFSEESIVLKESLEFLKKEEVKGEIHTITQFNMKRPADGLRVQVYSPDSLAVIQKQFGTWFQARGRGAGNYESEKVRFHLREGKYNLKIKDPDTARVYIYQDGLRWKELKVKGEGPTVNGFNEKE